MTESYGYESSQQAIDRLNVRAEHDGHSDDTPRALNLLDDYDFVGGKSSPEWTAISEQIVEDYLTRVGELDNDTMRRQLYTAPMLDKTGMMGPRVAEYHKAQEIVNQIDHVVATYTADKFVEDYGDNFEDVKSAWDYFSQLRDNPGAAKNRVMNFRGLDFLYETQRPENQAEMPFEMGTMKCFGVAQAYGYESMEEVQHIQAAARAIGAGHSLDGLSNCKFGDKGLSSTITAEDLELVQDYDRHRRTGLPIEDYMKDGVDSAAAFWRESLEESKQADEQQVDGPEDGQDGPTYTPEQGDYVMANVVTSAQHGGDFDRDVWLEREAEARAARVEAYEAAHRKGPTVAAKSVAEDMKQQLGDAVAYIKPKIQIKKKKLSFTGDGEKKAETGEAERVKEDAQRAEPEVKPSRLRKKIENKQAKPEEPAKPPKAPKNIVHQNSKTESEYIDDLMEKIATCKYDFVTYKQDVSRWTNPTEIQRQTDLRTKAYVHNMLDFCMSPLQNGVSPGNCVDCIGIYIGMAVASPEFRKYTNASIAKALYPATVARMKTVDAFRDCLPKATQRMVNWTERKFDCKVPFISDKIKSYEFRSDTTNARLEAKKEKFLKDLNNGRVPLTPETAALHYVSFIQQAYDKMHSSEVKTYTDCKAIQDKLNAATDTLKLLAERDGVNEADLNENVRALVGTLTTQHPEMRAVFRETAMFTVEKGQGREVSFDGKTTGRVWHGEYDYTQVGKDGKKHPFDGAFSARYPSSAANHVKQLSQYMSSLMKDIDNPDVIQALGASDIADKIRDHFKQNVVEDMNVPYVKDSFQKLCRECAEIRVNVEIDAGNAELAGMTDEQREAKIDEIAKDIRPEQAVWEKGVYDAAREWFEKHPAAKQALLQRDVVADKKFTEAELSAEAVSGERAKDVTLDSIDEETAGGSKESAEATMPDKAEALNPPPSDDSTLYQMNNPTNPVIAAAVSKKTLEPAPETPVEPVQQSSRDLGPEFGELGEYEGTVSDDTPQPSDMPDAGDYGP